MWLDKVFFQVYYARKHLFRNGTEIQHYFTLPLFHFGAGFKTAMKKQKDTLGEHPGERVLPINHNQNTHISEIDYYINTQRIAFTYPFPGNVNPLTSACKKFYIGT